MSNVVEDPVEESTVSLVGGILVDLQQLVEQQLRLTGREIEVELRRQSTAVVIFTLGVAGFFLAAVMLSMAAAELLHWLTCPGGTDPAHISMWACDALVGAVLIVVGGILAFDGQSRFRWVQPNQDETSQNL